MKKLLTVLLIILTLAFISPFPANAEKNVERISGDNRAETAVNISKEGWPNGADTVILATGQDYADALSSSTLAFALDAPILLASFPDRLSEATINELDRLDPDRIIIVGGEQAISDSLKQELEAADFKVDRISGSDRFQTGVNIAEEVLKLNPEQNEIIVAKGLDFPDALASASHAATAGTPIILTLEDRVPKAVQTFLDDNEINKSIVVGGEMAIHPSVADALPNAERVYGSSRYSTAVALADYFDANPDHVYIATGEDFPDALTGSLLAAKNGAPVLLTPQNRLLDSVVPAINKAVSATIFGGEKAVSNHVLNKISDELKVISEKEVKETVEIDFETIEIEDPSLNKGETKIEQEGKKGMKEITYNVTYHNGAEVKRVEISRETIQEPTDKVILVGTKEVETEIITEETGIAFESITEETDELLVGETEVKQEGSEGRLAIQYEVTYENGKLVSKVEIGREIIKEPVHEIILIGTREPAETEFNYDFEQKVIELVNIEREKMCVEPLIFDSIAGQIARDHSVHMLENEDYNHSDDYHAKLLEAGRDAYYAAENIAMGQATPEAVVNAWMNSTGHRNAILNPSYTHIGVGYALGDFGNITNLSAWTQVFYGPFVGGEPVFPGCD